MSRTEREKGGGTGARTVLPGRVFLLLLITLLLLNISAPAAMAKSWEHVISHRGAKKVQTEHTFAAYDAAIRFGSHYIEQDVVLSASGTLYVSHDRSAKRMTGVNRLFSDMTNREINQLRVKNGEQVHTLQSVFNRYGKKVTYVIELKEGAKQIDAFTRIIRKNKMENYVIVQSWSTSVLKELDKAFPKMPKMYLISNSPYRLQNALYRNYIDIICTNNGMLSADAVRSVQKAGKKYAVYTLNKTESLKRAITLGVDYYFTDDTKQALALEKKYRPAVRWLE